MFIYIYIKGYKKIKPSRSRGLTRTINSSKLCMPIRPLCPHFGGYNNCMIEHLSSFRPAI